MEPLRAATLVRDVPDFPKAGIIFKDITPVLGDPSALAEVVTRMAEFAERLGTDAVAGIESRGFILGSPVALALRVPFVPVRKAGKLPFTTVKEEYELEYGTNAVEVHTDAFRSGQRVLIVDDLLATGGTARAALRLVKRAGAKACAAVFMIELGFLEGRAALAGTEVLSLIRYD
jgi:adenine phosphoribosyltransferase